MLFYTTIIVAVVVDGDIVVVDVVIAVVDYQVLILFA